MNLFLLIGLAVITTVNSQGYHYSVPQTQFNYYQPPRDTYLPPSQQFLPPPIPPLSSNTGYDYSPPSLGFNSFHSRIGLGGGLNLDGGSIGGGRSVGGSSIGRGLAFGGDSIGGGLGVSGSGIGGGRSVGGSSIGRGLGFGGDSIGGGLGVSGSGIGGGLGVGGSSIGRGLGFGGGSIGGGLGVSGGGIGRGLDVNSGGIGGGNSFGSFQSTSHHNHQQQHHQAPVVTKHFYFHAAPEEPTPQPQVIRIGAPRRNYRVIFIKAPNAGKQSISVVPQQNEERTVIYVLTKQQDAADIEASVDSTPKVPSKPEVFFIKYKTQEEALHAQRQIQAQFETLGGSTQISNEGTVPVSSVIGSTAGHSKKTSSTSNDRYLPPSKYRY